jgi:FlaG/FlaF family flagellin (archaellin)
MEREDAVSPVIGTILLVAITVIILGVVSSFVFGMTENMQSTKIIAVTAQKVNDVTTEICTCTCCVLGGVGITLTNHGGKDARLLQDGENAFTGYIDGEVADGNGITLQKYVGSSGIYHAEIGRQHVVVKGNFIDGTQQVVLNTWA